MRLVTIKFPNSNRGYDYIVPSSWRRKIKIGDTVVVPPSSFKKESQEVKVIAVGATPKPNIEYVELIGYDKSIKGGEQPLKALEAAENAKAYRAKAEETMAFLLDQCTKYWDKQL